jgi:hypothetical protein
MKMAAFCVVSLKFTDVSELLDAVTIMDTTFALIKEQYVSLKRR